MKKIIILVCLLLCSVVLSQEQTVPTRKVEDTSLKNEVAWSAYLAKQVGGETEFVLPGGARVDILTEDIAWEVEWTKKWPESIGQALYYGSATNKKPGVWLLKKSDDDENWNECLSVINYLRGKGIDIEFRTELVK